MQVYSNSSRVSTVANNIADVKAVAAGISDVSAVAPNVEAVTTVANMGFAAESSTLPAGSMATASGAVVTDESGNKVYKLSVGIPAGASSYNDFTQDEDGVVQLSVIEIDDALSEESAKPVRNSVITAKIKELEAAIAALQGA